VDLPERTRQYVLAVALAGVITVALAVPTAADVAHAAPQQGGVAALFLAFGWAWPVVMYRNDQSESVHLDEGLLVVLLLTVPPPVTVLAFFLASAAAQVFRRRALVKSAFNTGQISLAAGAAALVVQGLTPAGGLTSPAGLAAVGAGALVFFLVNTAALVFLMATMGASVRESATDGLGIRVLLVGSCVVIGVPIGLAVTAYPWVLPGVLLPFAVLRQTLAGHFQSRHDHRRLSGLLESTLAVNSTMRPSDVEATLLAAARAVLRCSEAAIEPHPEPGEASVLLAGMPDRWLVVRGRPALEPFDETDRALLATLGAVGATALSNAGLFEDAGHQREQLSTLTASLGEAVLAIDREGKVTFLNPAAGSMLPALRVGHPAPYELLLAGERAMDRAVTFREEDTLVPTGGPRALPVALTASPVLRDEAVTGAVLVLRDITERKAFEEELARHAFEDSLTGLPNRRLFLDRLRLALRRSARSGETHAVLFIDVDRFKTVNDSLGHHAGDQLLVAIANRMRTVVRPGDTLARLGGDEFVILVEDVSSVEEARAVAERVAAQLEEPVVVAATHEVFVSASVGLALSQPDQLADDLLRDADVAMYQAKSRGTGRREEYDVVAMGGRSAERLDLEAALRRGLDRGELVAYYQPIVRTSDLTIVGAEALVRWRHPDRGLLLPASFIGLAEETGLILPIGDVILEEACGQARAWAELGIDVPVNVNLSARQFAHRGLVERVAQTLAVTGLAPDRLFLEIVETLAMEDAERTTEIILGLKELGVRFAIDDFGTGYSSLNYLKRFPVDEVKIDRSFVSGLGSDPVDTVIVRSVTQLVEALGMVVVAEGVETSAQLELLRSLRVGAAQGFLFSPPVEAHDFTELLGLPRLSACAVA